MGGMQLRGTAELQVLANRLKEAGDRGLTNRMRSEMRAVSKPVGLDVIQKGADRMPRRGGLRDRILAKKKVRVTASLAGRRVRVTLGLQGGANLKQLDSGVLRHPVYGNRRTWVSQKVFPHAWTFAFRLQQGKVRKAVLKAANETLDDVARGL